MHSETEDGDAYMQISCSKKQDGAFTLADRAGDGLWFAQCAAVDQHPILGLIVNNARYQASNEQAPLIHFLFGNSQPTFESASVFSDTSFYPMACISQFDRYSGTTEGLQVAGKLALKNCIE